MKRRIKVFIFISFILIIIISLVLHVPFSIEVSGTVIETSGRNSKQYVRVDIPMKYSGLFEVPRNIEICYLGSPSCYYSSILYLVSKEEAKKTEVNYFYGFSEIESPQKTGTKCSTKVQIDDKTIWQLMYIKWGI